MKSHGSCVSEIQPEAMIRAARMVSFTAMNNKTKVVVASYHMMLVNAQLGRGNRNASALPLFLPHLPSCGSARIAISHCRSAAQCSIQRKVRQSRFNGSGRIASCDKLGTGNAFAMPRGHRVTLSS